MADSISWVATVATILAALMTASNLGSRITGYGFCVFLIGSLSWLAVGLLTDQIALLWTNVALTLLNVFGVWRWLGRQARIEDSATRAAEASENSTGETLFPVSLLIKASVVNARGAALGKCVDAMAGSTGGQLRYVVASEGGVVGVGEKLWRLPWTQARMDRDNLVADIESLNRMEEIAKDEWPAN